MQVIFFLGIYQLNYKKDILSHAYIFTSRHKFNSLITTKYVAGYKDWRHTTLFQEKARHENICVTLEQYYETKSVTNTIVKRGPG